MMRIPKVVTPFSLALLLATLRLAARGTLPFWITAVLAPVFLLLAVAPFTIGKGGARASGSFIVLAVGTVIGLPTLGASGLVDPWETHYAEVAREMIARHDPISPWWANEGWFESKPVLLFWLEALAMRVLGVGTGADHVIDARQHPEWAVRLPGFLLALAGVYVLYLGVARVCGRRAALLGAIVLWTMPGFALLSRQALTDMPLVAGIAASLGFALLSLHTSDGAIASRRVGPYAAIAIAAVILPQILVILLQGRLAAGSPETCMLPGHPACAALPFAHPRLTPLLQASMWFVPASLLVSSTWEETRLARLFALGAWGCAAFAAMAKGPAGLVIPAGAVLVHAIAQRSVRPLLRFEIALGLLLAATMIAPWYLAIFARHGKPFVHELVVHHMLGRTLDHLHDTNDGEDVGITYFVRQLGYATFPWSGVALAGVLSLPANERSRRGLVHALLFGAAMISFALVSTMATKFHHYMLIVLPPAAMLAGLQLAKPRPALLVVAAAVTAIVGRDLAAEPASFIRMLTYRYARVWPSAHAFSSFVWVIAGIAALAFAAAAIARVRRAALAASGAAALALSLVLVNVYLPRAAVDGGQRALYERYYAATDRKGELVAYQLNWKGENFYTGDRVAIFIASGAPFRKYIDERRAHDDRIVYAVTERARVRSLKSELGPVTSFAELTTGSEGSEGNFLDHRLSESAAGGSEGNFLDHRLSESAAGGSEGNFLDHLLSESAAGGSEGNFLDHRLSESAAGGSEFVLVRAELSAH